MTKEKLFNKLKNRGIFWSYSKELTYYAIESIGLFGSYARGEATHESDIDIFVQMKPDLFKLVELKEKIEEDLQKKVDIIRNHKYMKPFLLKMIQKEIAYAWYL